MKIGAEYDGDDFYCDVAIPESAQLDVVHEDDLVLAFRHTRPFWQVHIVAVPKRHIASLTRASAGHEPDIRALLTVVQSVSRRRGRSRRGRGADQPGGLPGLQAPACAHPFGTPHAVTTEPVAVVAAFGRRLADLGWISALHVGGSLATGDHQPGVSDLDLVAVTDGPVTHERQATLRSIHEAIAPEAKLGCTYVPEQLVGVPDHTHTTWTHGELFERWLSGIARAELLRHGYSVFGPEPTDVWPSMTADEVRQTVVDELTGYWSWAVRRPWLWSSTDQVDLSVTTMLRARHTLVTGELITKSAALTGDDAARCVPAPLVRRGRARRAGADAHPGARLPLEALAAWRLTRRTIAVARGRTPYFPRMILRTRSQRSLIEDSAPNEVGR